MFKLLFISQLVLAILLIALVLVQKANTDASGAFGADGANGASYEKRGAEKVLHRITVAVAFLFAASILYTVVK